MIGVNVVQHDKFSNKIRLTRKEEREVEQK